jgi:autotransporter passenger strand-loop-strand repeat protein
MSTPAWITDLPAGVVRSDLLADAVGGVLTYADALKVLTDVENAGTVTASEFAALQTVAANLNNGLLTSAYVASIFGQLVDGSPANADWTGGASGTTTPLGNLEAGTTSAHLGELIGQWFLGTNLPDPKPLGATGSPYPYAAISAPLYGASGAASVNDICQGGDGDCELLAGVIDVVENHPQQLASMIVANPNGTWGVRFYVNGNEVWETVNNKLPTYSGGDELLYAHNPNEQNTALWVALVEKAYAQLSATGLIGHPAIDGYANINADSAANVQPDLADASQVNYYFSTQSNFYSDKAWYIDAVDSGDDVVVETGGSSADTHDGKGKIELVGDHAFAVVGYDSATGDFIVRNPWGAAYSSQDWDTQFEVSLTGIAGVQGDIAIDDTGGDTSEIRLDSESGQILANTATSIVGFFAAADTTGAAATRYNLQLLGGGAIKLNGAPNLATAAQTSLGQIVVSASGLSKVTISATAGAGQQDLLVSAYDGTVWSATADIQLAVSPASLAVNPVLGNLVAAGGAVPVSSLFTASGAPGAFFAFIVPDGDGEINLNGAQNLWPSGESGSETYEVSGSQLSLLTYAAPSTGGSVAMQVQDYANGAWSDWQSVQINVGVTVGAALLDYADGQLAGSKHISDSAANIFANLNALQSAFQAGELTSIIATDTTPQDETLSQKQYTADRGLLSILQGDVAITVEQVVSRGVTVSGATVASDQVQVVENGGVALSTDVSSGGKQLLQSGGSASGSLVSSGGELEVLAGGAATAATLRGGQELDYGSASGDAVSSGGAEIVEHGGVDSGAKVANGGVLTISSGGVARGTVVSSGGSEIVSAGGVVSGLSVLSGGRLVDDGVVRIAGAGTLAGTLSGPGAVVETGGGDLLLSGSGAAFDGRGVIGGGTIELATSGALGTGYVQFLAPATGSAVLQIDAADAPAAGGTFANRISNFSGANEDIDLRSIAFVSGASATLSGSSLVLSDGGKTYRFHLAGSIAGAYPVLSDGHGGTLIDPDAVAFGQAAAALSPSHAGGACATSSGGSFGDTPFLHATASVTAAHFWTR